MQRLNISTGTEPEEDPAPAAKTASP
jgi:hypothetical protein